MTKPQVHLLVVEDDIVDRMACRRALAQNPAYDFTLYEAETGRQGLQLASTHAIDCILLDYHLPDLDGIEFLKELRGEMAEIPVPVMMLTGSDNAAIAVEAMKRGARDYLVKDVERQYLELLPAVIERVLREQALISEKKHTEQMLWRAEANYRILVEQIPAITYIADIDNPGSNLYISPQVATLGYTPEEWLAEPNLRFKLIHPEDISRVNADINQARTSRQPLRTEYRMLTRDKRTLWIRDQATVVLGENGQPLFLQGILIDISEMKVVVEELSQHRHRLEELVVKRTVMLESANASLRQEVTERRQIETELFEEKEFAQVTLASIGDAVITADTNGKIGYMNPLAEQLTGWGLSEARGQAFAEVFNIVDEASREPIQDIVAKCLANGSYTSMPDHNLLIRRDGMEYAVDDCAAPIRNRDATPIGVVIVFHDVTQQRQLSRQLSYQASHDPLTGLVNRAEFEQRLVRVLASAHAEKFEHALCYLDLDQFKVVNDTCGHNAGDELLRQISALLHEKMRQRDTLARLGGDEFGILLEHCHLDQAIRLCNELCEAVRSFRFVWRDKPFSIGISIGVVSITPHTENASTVMSAADTACYIAKEKGRNRVHVYQEDDSDFAERRSQMQWVSRLTQALDENRFRLCYQPITPLSGVTGERPHYEILLRLLDDGGNLVEPAAFIPAAERFNLMPAIDRWVLRQVVANCAASPSGHAEEQPPIFAVNLSGASLSDDNLVGYIRGLLEEYQVAPDSLCFEITETTAMANLQRAMQFMNELKKIGCWFALDNFGGAMSSFTYIKKLPVDFIKIDGSFIKSIIEDEVNRALANAINQIAHVMAIQTVAECAETDIVLDMLKQLGVDHAQGWAIAAPRPLEELRIGNSTISSHQVSPL
ncbi:EAL domain-containing protein [Rhodoferax sp. UBA5149]|uniref:EAL domain-containing protein n=1 Tax=Rhodoferax sp. UBA5149 TaxID=1947379 RepID=UPI0025E8BE94|nr:EAL domain-containing protein [Rhodoferax sp. UBA5149]